MSIDLLSTSTSRPDHWIRQSAGRLNQVITWVNQFRYRNAIDANYTINKYDQYLGLDGGHTITLAIPTSGRQLIIKDEAGTAGSANITVVGTIDGATNATISTNYGVLRLVADGTNWFTI